MPRSIPASSTDAPDAAVVDAVDEGTAAPATFDPRQLGRFVLRRRGTLLGLLMFGGIVILAVFAPLIAPHDPLRQDITNILKPPVWEEGGHVRHVLGTDSLGRDILSRLLHGARYSLLISVCAVLLGSALGFLVGLVAGFFGGWVDTLLMRLGDIQLAFPFVLFAIAVLGVSPERTPLQLILVLGLASWVTYARVARGRVLSERAKDYARAARALGASQPRLLFRYILPNVWQVLPPLAIVYLGFFVIVESLLSFLALGLTPPTPSWGSFLAEGKQYMMVSAWMPVFPGLAILVTVLGINLAADGLTEYFDPKSTRSGFLGVPAAVLSARQLAGSRPVVGGGETPLLSVRNLTTVFPLEQTTVHAVRGVSFDLHRGQVLGIVGESGSGKSVTALSIIRLLDAPGRVIDGEILLDGLDLSLLDERGMARVRGKRLGMIFQNPGASLNPVLGVGYQLIETVLTHRRVSAAQAHDISLELLRAVGIGDPPLVLNAYPFQLSGGMQQRVMIALAMACEPDVLIADEPTTALDVTTQAQLLDRVDELRRRYHTSVIFITHDIALLADFADVIMVIYAGQVCEIGPRQQLIDHPRHPYTRALLNAVARADVAPDIRLAAIPGDLPDPTHPAPGCPFAPRCPQVMTVCHELNPSQTQVAATHAAACHLIESQVAAPASLEGVQ